MSREVTTWLFFLSLLTISVALVYLLKFYSRQTPPMKWLAAVLLFSLSCDIGAWIAWQVGGNPNILSNTYTLFSTSIITVFFLKIIEWKSLNRFYIVLNILYIIAVGVNIFYASAGDIIPYVQVFQAVIIISLSLVFYYKLLQELPTQQLQRMPLFWIVSGFFFSYSGKIVIFTAMHYLVTVEKDNLILAWAFHNFLTNTANLLFCIGASIQYKQIKSTLAPA